MGIAMAVVALIASLAFNYLQYRWRREDRDQHRRERADSQADRIRQEAEHRSRERTPPEIYNMCGAPNPIRITGSQHSVQGPFVDLWGAITVANPTQTHMKIEAIRLVINGANWEQDYNLHLSFPENKVPSGLTGDFWLTSSNRSDEPFSIPVRFA
jgi:hypothetical protein